MHIECVLCGSSSNSVTGMVDHNVSCCHLVSVSDHLVSDGNA